MRLEAKVRLEAKARLGSFDKEIMSRTMEEIHQGFAEGPFSREDMEGLPVDLADIRARVFSKLLCAVPTFREQLLQLAHLGRHLWRVLGEEEVEPLVLEQHRLLQDLDVGHLLLERADAAEQEVADLLDRLGAQLLELGRHVRARRRHRRA